MIIALIAGILVLGILIFFLRKKKNKTGSIRLTSKEAFDLINNPVKGNKPVILDVRTQSEFAGGHIKGSVNMDFHSPAFQEMLGRMERDKKYILYCRSGIRSANAVTKMQGMGFKDVCDIRGGVIGWNSEKLPLNT